MKHKALVLGVILAVLVIAQIATANTVFDVFAGLQSNIIGQPTDPVGTWIPVVTPQPHNNGWSYAYLDSAVYPPQGWWSGLRGSAFTVNASDYIEMDRVWASGRSDTPMCWGANVNGGSQQMVTDATTTTSRYMAWGVTWPSSPDVAAVGMNNVGGGASYMNWNAIRWTAPAAGILSISYTCYGMSGCISEMQLGIMHGSSYTHLADANVSATVWAGHPEVTANATLAPANINCSAGDVIWLVQRSGGWNGANVSNNVSVTGGITYNLATPGSISGTVTSSLGGPVAGVTVSAGSASAATGADGTYTINGLDPGTYTVTAHKDPGYADNSVSGIVVNSGSNTPGANIVITPWGTITGVVSDVFGPVAGATVSTASNYPANTQTTTTDGAGHYSIIAAAGTYTLYAKAGKHVDGSVAGVSVTNPATTTQNITLVSWGKLTGTVSGSAGVIAGATVSDSTAVYTATTAADGTYTILIPAGSYPMTAKKPGLEPSTQTVAMTNDTTTTQNFTLGDGVVISGTVTESSPGNAPLAGVLVWPADGSNSATTDAAGHYSLGVSRGSYIVGYSKTGYAPKFPTVAAPTTNVTQNIVLDKGWDLASDFNASNPNGAWTYGCEVGSAVAFSAMGYQQQTGVCFAYTSTSTDQPFAINNALMFDDNNTVVPNLDGAIPPTQPSWIWTSTAHAWREGMKVVSSPGFNYSSQGRSTDKSVARFTAPFSGYYTVTAKFSGVTPTGTTTGVALRSTIGASSSYLLGDPATSAVHLNGFAGRAINMYTDSTGTNPVVVYSQAREVSEGEMIDAILYGMNTGWTQVDLTVAYSGTFIKGKVTSDLPGNPPVIEAVVGGQGGGIKYTGLTNATGDYLLSVAGPDVYDMEARHGGYDMGVSTATVALGGVATSNMRMHHQGKWDVAVDFITSANPNGQWTYGDLNPVAPDYLFTPYDTYQYLYDPRIGNNNGSGTNQPIYRWTSAGASHVAKNTSSTPFTWSAWDYWMDQTITPPQTTPPHYNPAYQNTYWYIEPQAVFLESLWTGDGSTSRKHLAAIRWTAPDARVVSIHGRFIKSGYNYDQAASIVKNGAVLLNRVLTGFVGTNAHSFTDSIGPAPIQSFATVLPVASGDTIDVVQDLNWQSGYGWSTWGYNGTPESNVGLELVIENGSGTICTSISQLKQAALGTTVFLTTPMTITAAINRYGSLVPSYVAYIESDDRSQALKLVGDSNTPVVAEGWKITFTGKVVADPDDATRNVIQILSINSGIQATDLKPLGMTTKSVATALPTARDKFVRVFGIVKSVVANTDPTTNDRWPYEYYVINDGGQDLKIKMHGQATSMTDPTPLAAATVGHYLAVKGIVIKEGTDMVVVPRGYGSGLSDVDDYKQTGAQP